METWACLESGRTDSITREFVGAVDLARYTIGHAGPDELGFGEVIEPVNAFRVGVPQQKHRA